VTPSGQQSSGGNSKRVAPITFPASDSVLARPGTDQSATVRDAFRECGFALGADISWLQRALSLQREIVAQSYPSRYRNQRYAAALLLWSRTYTTSIELLRLTTWGRYAVCPPLVRSCIEWLAAGPAIVGEDFDQFESWIDAAFAPASDQAATAFGMGQYMASQEIASDETLATIYRAATELARPHFGASALVVAPESNAQRIQINWGDESFHLGWAELLLGWQIEVQMRQLEFAAASELFAAEVTDHEDRQALVEGAQRLLAAPNRCRVGWVEGGGAERLLVDNFRRQPSGAPRRILL
jgi:hypothetical protein